MKKIVLTFGLISAAISSVLMIVTMVFLDFDFDRGFVIGYTCIVAAMLLIHFGVRAYRDNVAGGSVGFGRALSVGLLIGLISSIGYTATWEVIYYGFRPDFMDKYAAYELDAAKKHGATPAELSAKAEELRAAAESYKNPIVNIAYTMIEPLPVVILISLLSAAVVSRRKTYLQSSPLPTKAT
jgi:hypothetical protein